MGRTNMFYYDFITATKQLNSDSLNTKYLKKIKEEWFDSYSIVYYQLILDKTPINVIHYPEYNKLSIAGSLPYFLLGHNYSITMKKEMDVIEYISNILNTDVFKFDVVNIEAASVTEIPFPVKHIFQSHNKIQGMKTQCYSHGKYFENVNLLHKIYDFQKNFKQKVPKEIRHELALSTDYSSDKVYVKIENKYKRPDIALKHRGLTIENLFEPNFIQLFKDDLLNVYNSIKKTGTVIIENKKQLSSFGICLIALKQMEETGDYDTATLMRETIKSYPDILTKDDQKARLSHLSNTLKKIELGNCKYDISNLLEKSLNGL